MTIASVVSLLQTALLLLQLAQGPNVPPSLHDQAVRVANQAIAVATQMLKNGNSATTSSTQSAQTTSLVERQALQDREWGPYGVDSIHILAGYAGLASDGTYSDSIRTAARDSLKLANTHGITHVRFAISGPYFEQLHTYTLMRLWQTDPNKYFDALDLLFKDASDLHMHLEPILIFGIIDIPEMNNTETLCGLKAPALPYGEYTSYAQYVESAANTLPLIPQSHNNTLMTALALQVVDRYKASPALGFWELGNELNLYAKERSFLANVGGTDYYTQCLTRADIKTAFQKLAQLVKGHDSAHKIAAGLIQESGNEWPLADIPGDMNDMGDVFRYFNSIPEVDIADVHLYSNVFDSAQPGQGSFYKSTKGEPPVSVTEAVQYFKRQADRIGKELFIGEYGIIDAAQSSGACNPATNGWNDSAQFPYLNALHTVAQSIGVKFLSAFSWNVDIFAREYPSQRSSTRCLSLKSSNSGALSIISDPRWKLATPLPLPTLPPVDDAQSRNAKRMDDITTLKNALEAYRAATASYPQAGASDEGPSINTLQELLVPNYLSSLPHDPKYVGTGGDYYYVWGNGGTSYALWVNFDNAGSITGACVTGVNVKTGWWSSTPRCNF